MPEAEYSCQNCLKRFSQGSRFLCLNCQNYTLCNACIKEAARVHTPDHVFKRLRAEQSAHSSTDSSLLETAYRKAATDLTAMALPTKDQLLELLIEEEKRRLSPKIQAEYHRVESDEKRLTGEDWMDVTARMQLELVREYGYSDRAVEMLRRAQYMYPDDDRFRTTQLYVRNNIARKGTLTSSSLAPDVLVHSLDSPTHLQSFLSFASPARPLVVFAGSYT